MDYVILDKSRVRSYLDSIAEGFAKNPLEVALSLAAIGLLIAAAVIVLLWWKRKERKRREEISEKAFETLSRKVNITLSEIDQIRTMARYTKDGKNDVTRLMKDTHYFNAAAGRAVARGVLSDRSVAALRFRLGHHQKEGRGALKSTVELKPGTIIMCETRNGTILQGRIHENGPSRFSASFTEGSELSGWVALSIARKTGLYRCKVHVLGGKNSTFDFQHTEKINRIQKRGALRKKLKLSVIIHYQTEDMKDEEDMLSIRGRIVELSQSGALITSTSPLPEQGSVVNLSFLRHDKNPVEAKAIVVRSEPEEKTVAVHFQGLSEKLKERILKTVFH